MKIVCLALLRTSDALNRIAIILAAACVLAMFGVVFLQVIARYVFASPPFWTEELGRWLMVWAALLGASVAFKFHADPSLVVIPRTNSARRRLQLVARMVAAWLFLAPVIYFSVPYVERQFGRLSEGLEVSTAWLALSLPVAAGLICFHAFAELVRLLITDLPPEEQFEAVSLDME